MSYAKYTTALAMMDLTVAESEKITVISKAARVAMNTAWDDLYTFVFANFKEPETKMGGVPVTKTHAEVLSMDEMFTLNREEIEAEMHKIPPTILEQCFPVWMARYMLRFRRVGVSPDELVTFDKFHKMYGNMIIKSSDKRTR